MTFRAGWIDEPEDGVRALVLHDVTLDETLELQRGHRDADHETAREDLCCLVRNGAAVTYGGVEGFDLSGSRLTLTLTLEAATVLALPRAVPYDLDDEGLVLVQQRLHEILG